MPLKKIAISIPADVLKAIDGAARQRGESRSSYISRILRAAARARRDAEITRKLDELFADRAVAGEQQKLAQQLRSVGSRRQDEDW